MSELIRSHRQEISDSEAVEKLSGDLVEAYETLTLMYRTVSNLGGLFRLEDITAYLLNRGLEAVDATEGVLYIQSGGGLEPVAVRDDAVGRIVTDAPLRLARLGKPLFFHGTMAAEFSKTGVRPIENLLSAPLETGGRTVGVLVLLRDGDQQFTTGEAKLVGALCGLTAVAIANFQHYRAISYEREMLEGVIREIGDGIVVMNTDWRTRLTNGTARRFLQVTDSEPEGFDALSRLILFDLSVEAEVLRAGAELDGPFLAESRDPRRPLVLEVKVLSARFGADGEPIRLLCLRDVTREHREAEAQRDFLSLASHKLRTPLTKVLGMIPIARDDEAGKELKAEAFDGIEHGADELRDLVDGILQFVEFRQGDAVVGEADLHALIVEARDAVSTRRADRVIDAVISVTASTTHVRGARNMLLTMLGHLIDNAVKYSRKNPAWVRVSLGDAPAGGVQIVVEDRGDGIAPELLSKLFTPFSQRDEDFTGQADGAGLGLMLVSQAVVRHGGTIHAESSLGAGSKFTVMLPRDGVKVST